MVVGTNFKYLVNAESAAATNSQTMFGSAESAEA